MYMVGKMGSSLRKTHKEDRISFFKLTFYICVAHFVFDHFTHLCHKSNNYVVILQWVGSHYSEFLN